MILINLHIRNTWEEDHVSRMVESYVVIQHEPVENEQVLFLCVPWKCEDKFSSGLGCCSLRDLYIVLMDAKTK